MGTKSSQEIEHDSISLRRALAIGLALLAALGLIALTILVTNSNRQRDEALAAAAQAKADLKASIARRLASATDQIASAEAAAIRQVREQAVSVAVAAAGDVLSKQMTA